MTGEEPAESSELSLSSPAFLFSNCFIRFDIRDTLGPGAGLFANVDPNLEPVGLEIVFLKDNFDEELAGS